MLQKFEVIEARAKEARKALNNKIDLEPVMKYIRSLGYDLVSYKKNVIDKRFFGLGVCDEWVSKDAFLFTTDELRWVCFNIDLHPYDKLYVLLRELGHIELKHINLAKNDRCNCDVDGCNCDVAVRDGFFMGMEADVFAYLVLNPREE